MQRTLKGNQRTPTCNKLVDHKPHKATAINRSSTLEGAKYPPASSSHVVGTKADGAAQDVNTAGEKKTTEESSKDA
jgi:hypothetical protein